MYFRMLNVIVSKTSTKFVLGWSKHYVLKVKIFNYAFSSVSYIQKKLFLVRKIQLENTYI